MGLISHVCSLTVRNVCLGWEEGPVVDTGSILVEIFDAGCSIKLVTSSKDWNSLWNTSCISKKKKISVAGSMTGFEDSF